MQQSFASPYSRLFALRENITSARWERRELCMGQDDVCTGDLVGIDRRPTIMSFGEDEDGELYIAAVSNTAPLVALSTT